MTIVATITIPDKFETLSEAKERRALKVRILGKGKRTARKLAAKLDQCRKGQGCESGACDVCVGRERLKLYRETRPIFAAHSDWTRASVIPAGFLIPVGKLSTVDLKVIVARINKRLERSSLCNRIVIAGIDISLNLQDNKIVGWQLHLYISYPGGKHATPAGSDKGRIPSRADCTHTASVFTSERFLKGDHLSFQEYFQSTIPLHECQRPSTHQGPPA
jgi:hypothetical protein